jgi:hypothetical protein
VGVSIPLKVLTRTKTWRIIPSRFPPVDLFDAIVEVGDQEAVFEIESLTNDRVRTTKGIITLIPAEDRNLKNENSFVLAPFTHLNPEGSRFSDGTWGVYYAGFDLDTAIAETKYHRERFLKATNEGPGSFDVRVITAKVTGDFQDITAQSQGYDKIHDPNSYGESKLARGLKQRSSNGIYYNSVRKKGGHAIAIFKPKLISSCLQERHLEYIWDGAYIRQVFEKRLLD